MFYIEVIRYGIRNWGNCSLRYLEPIIEYFRREKYILLALLGGSIASIAIVLLFSSLMVASPSIVNGFCTVCHTMKTFASDVIETPHGRVECTRCHSVGFDMLLRGVVVELGLRSFDPRELATQRLYIYGQCLSCHRPENLGSKTIHVVHFSMLNNARTCTVCHDSHDMRTSSNTCLSCHNLASVRASHIEFHDEALYDYQRGVVTCWRCHSQQATWEIPIPPGAFTAAVRGASCFTCHQTLPDVTDIGNCLRCHNR